MATVSGKTLVVTDTHLGYANSDVRAFESFLDYVSGRSDVDSLVIMGDFVDMWRRDVSGLFLETREVVAQLLEIGDSIELSFIVGNHDYHLRKLLDHGYPFVFQEAMAPVSYGQGGSHLFMHGWEFDDAQQPPVMEALCYNLSDEAGQDRTRLYNAFTDAKSEVENLFRFHGGEDKYLAHLLQGPETRLQQLLPDIERKAYASLKPGEILVFGHTHRPFVSADGRLANAGSWVTDAQVHNTFVELDGNVVRLFVYGASGITEVTERTPLSQLT